MRFIFISIHLYIYRTITYINYLHLSRFSPINIYCEQVPRLVRCGALHRVLGYLSIYIYIYIYINCLHLSRVPINIDIVSRGPYSYFAMRFMVFLAYCFRACSSIFILCTSVCQYIYIN